MVDKNISKKSNSQLTCDFTSGAIAHRLRFGGGRNQALPKAVGLSRGRTPEIIDATAGLGRDAFLLASLGANVTMIERSAQVYSALRDGLLRAKEGPADIAGIISRMTLINGDAKEVLFDLDAQVILVDPMHPPRRGSALVKKEMRMLRQLVGADEDALELMRTALKVATNRVVLKWPLRAKPMPGLQSPSHQICGKTTRYDVFMT
jgi:16S rRNA (guanine1516-N2)-methyltransferase